MRFSVRFGLAAALVAGLGAGAWYVAGRPVPGAPGGDSAGPAAPADPGFEVRVARVERTAVPVAFEFTGVVVSPSDAALRPRVTGTVVERPFEPGDFVDEGQTLFRIDPRPFEVALRVATAQRDQAKAQLAFAELEVRRIEPLEGEGFASTQRLQQLESNRAVAAARLQEAEAEIARQQLNSDYAVVRAPFKGRTSLSDVNVGDLVTANQTDLVSLVQIDPIDVQVALSAEASVAVQAAMDGGEPSVAVLAGEGRPEKAARIYKLDNRFNPGTARRLVRALLENADGRFLPGEFVRTRVRVGTKERLLVPTVALSSQLDRRVVHAVGEDGEVRVRPVETGGDYGEMTAVASGLDAGALVAVDHLQDLRQGQRVRVRLSTGGSRDTPGPRTAASGP